MDLLKLAKALITIPSVSGSEGPIADFLIKILRAQSFTVRAQKVEGKRRNILAAIDPKPRVLLCTHLDTVPGPARATEDARYIYGRGACDAKGIIASMVAAAVGLKAEGVTGIGLLLLVGEEDDSLGAKTAARLDTGSEFIIVGEPTENKLGIGHKGVLILRLDAKGRKSHSASPQQGKSAIEKLLDVLQDIRRINLGKDRLLGSNTLNIGKIEGGTAHNVIPDNASAVVSIRAATPTDLILKKFAAAVDGRLSLKVLGRSEPQRLYALPGFRHTILPYGTDIPYLHLLGRPLLAGPGSIKDAHSDHEKVAKKQLLAAVENYKKMVRALFKEN